MMGSLICAHLLSALLDLLVTATVFCVLSQTHKSKIRPQWSPLTNQKSTVLGGDFQEKNIIRISHLVKREAYRDCRAWLTMTSINQPGTEHEYTKTHLISNSLVGVRKYSHISYCVLRISCCDSPETATCPLMLSCTYSTSMARPGVRKYNHLLMSFSFKIAPAARL